MWSCLCRRLVWTKAPRQEGTWSVIVVSANTFICPIQATRAHPSIWISDLCTRFKKIFTHEHTLFTSAQLTKHYKFGDKAINKDDDSGFTGHPECAFCKSSFYGDDELFEHCRDKHEQCHICVRNNIRHQYYANYDQLVSFLILFHLIFNIF